MWNERWENEFLFTFNIFNEAECIVCNQKIKKIKASCLLRHYDSCHSELRSVTGNEREDYISKLKKRLQLKNNQILNSYNKNSNFSNCNPVKATYNIALALAKKGRPFEDGEYLKETFLSTLQYLGEPAQQTANIIKELPLFCLSFYRN